MTFSLSSMDQQPVKQPLQADLRRARQAGFQNAIRHLPEERRARLTSSYQAQAARREHVVSKFLENKYIEWDNYSTQVTEYEIEKYLPIL